MRRFWLDVVLCVLFIFSLMGIFSSITFFKIFEVFDPIGEMFSDFELTDIVISKIRKAPPADDGIVIVNVGDLNREQISQQIQILSKYEPAVIGVDITFGTPKPYSEDSLLEVTLANTSNVVIGSELRLYNEKNGQFDTLIIPAPRLAQYADFGFVNTITEAENQDDLKSCREMTPVQYVKGEKQYAFPVMLAMAKDPVKTQKFLDRGNEFEIINYKGNVMDFGESNFGTRYYVLDVYDVLDESFAPEIIKDKVIIICYLGSYIGDLQTRTDKYYTPLNKRYAGKSEPDMFGGVIHANVVSMILQEDYIEEMSTFWTITLAIIICFLNVTFFKWIYGALSKWYDGVTKLFQLLQILFFSSLMVALFHYFNFKADFSLTIIVIALSGDSIEVYQGVLKNLFSKRERQVLFKINWKFYKQ